MMSMCGSFMGLALLAGCVAHDTPTPRVEGIELDDRLGDAQLSAQLSAAASETRLRTAAYLPDGTTTEPLQILLFPTRPKMAQWAEQEGVREFAMIDRGGISGDFGVALYYVGVPDTLRTARHETVHQTLRAAPRRLPPFIEEGFATMLDGGGDKARLEALRALDVPQSIGMLIATRADGLYAATMAQRTAWYAQAWAVAVYIDRRAPTFWQAYFDGTMGLGALLTELTGTDWPGVEADYLRFVREELLR